MDEYDYIVVGAGSAGAIVASRLAEDPGTTVLLLEAGGSDRTALVRKPGMISLVHQVKQLKRGLDWGFYTVPQRHMNGRRLPYTRGKVLGGSSSINGMLYLRGNKENYNRWASLGCAGWGYRDVLPFYRKLENHQDGACEFHGASGPIHISRHPDDQISDVSFAFMRAVADVCRIPILDDFNSLEQNCVSLYQMSSRNGVRSSTAEGYLRAKENEPNLVIQVRALARRVLVEGGRAYGVEYSKGTQRVRAKARREVVLSAGSIGSPQLLMLSGIGPADHLAEQGIDVVVDSPGVGKNLHDHLFVPLTFRSPTARHRGTARHFFWGMIKEYLKGGSWFGRTVFEAGAFIKSQADTAIPDIQLHTLPWGYPDPNQDGPERPHVDKGRCLTVMPTMIYPKSRGELLLASSDPAAAPLIDPAFLKEPDDVRLLVKGVRLSREICAHPDLAAHLHEELAPGKDRATDDELEAEVRLRATTVYHPVGTCKMGIDDMAVVDPTLRVRGVEALRVADASIMPHITGGNTNAPAMMIGERAAALIGGHAPPT